jgi:hypothetical protein
MDSRVSEVARDVYRISTFHPEFGIQFPVRARLELGGRTPTGGGG